MTIEISSGVGRSNASDAVGSKLGAFLCVQTQWEVMLHNSSPAKLGIEWRSVGKRLLLFCLQASKACKECLT